jgi:hypothetical protein
MSSSYDRPRWGSGTSPLARSSTSSEVRRVTGKASLPERTRSRPRREMPSASSAMNDQPTNGGHAPSTPADPNLCGRDRSRVDANARTLRLAHRGAWGRARPAQTEAGLLQLAAHPLGARHAPGPSPVTGDDLTDRERLRAADPGRALQALGSAPAFPPAGAPSAPMTGARCSPTSAMPPRPARASRRPALGTSRRRRAG